MNPLDPTCDEFLEAPMSAAERSRLAIRLGHEPRPATAVDLYGDVESSLRRSFAVPDLSNLIGRVEAAAAQMRQGGRDAIEGTIRWFAAAAALLFMFVTVCFSTLLAPVSERVEGESMRGWSSSLVEAVGMTLSTASALVAFGVRLRRDRDGRIRLHRFGTSVALPPGLEVIRTGRASVVPGGCSLLFERVGQSVRLLVAPAAGHLGMAPRPDRPDRMESIDEPGYFRRELDSVLTCEAANGSRVTAIDDCSEFALSRGDGWGTACLAA